MQRNMWDRKEDALNRRPCLFQEEAWLDIIFSQREEDLPELVSEYPLSAALRELTPQQREILRLNLVFGIPAGRSLKELGAPPEISPSFGRRRWRNFGILWAAARQRQHFRRRVDCPNSGCFLAPALER